MASSLPIKPLGKRVLVKPEDSQDTTPSGLVISSNTQEKPQVGIVISLGVGAKNEDNSNYNFNVNVGDKVYFKKYSPDEIELDSEQYLDLNEADILAGLSKYFIF